MREDSELLKEVDRLHSPAVIPSAEPAIKIGTAATTVAGVLSLIAYFSPNLLTPRQTDLILVISAVALPLITAFFIRKRVWSPASVIEVVQEAVGKGIEEYKKNSKYTIPTRKPTFPPDVNRDPGTP